MLFSSFWKRGPGPPLWGPGGVLGPPPLDPPQVHVNLTTHKIIKTHTHTHANIIITRSAFKKRRG